MSTDTTVSVALEGKDNLSPPLTAAAQGAEEAAQAVDLAQQAVKQQQDAAEAATPALHALAEELVAAKKAAQEEAEALGISTVELARLKAQLAETKVQAETVVDTNERVTTGARRMGDVAGTTGASLMKLAGGMAAVSPEGAELLRTGGDLADVLEVVSSGAGAAGISIGSLMGVLVPVAAAVAALAVAWKVYSDELAAAEAREARQRQVLTELIPVAQAVKKAREDLALASGTMTQAEHDRATAERDAAEMVEKGTETLRARRTELEAQLAEEKRLVGEGYGKHQQAVDELNQALANNTTQIEAVRTAGEAYVDLTVEAAENARLAADAERHYEENLRKRAEATRSAAEAERTAQAALKAAQTEASALLDRRAAAEAQLHALALQAASADEQARAAYRARVDAIRAAIDLGADEADVLAAKSAALKLLAEDLAAATEAQRTLTVAAQETADVQDGAANPAAVGAGITGGPSAGVDALSNAGPWGEMIAGLVEAIVNLGDQVDEHGNVTKEGLLSTFQAYHDGIMDALANLPNTLADNLDKILSDSMVMAVPAFVSSLADRLPDLFEGVMSAIPSMVVELTEAMTLALPQAIIALIGVLSDPNTWIDMIQSFVLALVDAVKGLFGGKSDGGIKQTSDDFGIGEWLDKTWKNLTQGSDYVGTYATGTDYVNRTGWAFVHQGERIFSPTGATSGTSAAMMSRGGGGTTNVYFPPGLIVGTTGEVVRAINGEMGTGGQDLAWGS